MDVIKENKPLNKLAEKLNSPSLWLAMIIGFSALIVTYNDVGVIGTRLDKKIEIQNEHNDLIKGLILDIELLKQANKYDNELHDKYIEILELKIKLNK